MLVGCGFWPKQCKNNAATYTIADRTSTAPPRILNLQCCTLAKVVLERVFVAASGLSRLCVLITSLPFLTIMHCNNLAESRSPASRCSLCLLPSIGVLRNHRRIMDEPGIGGRKPDGGWFLRTLGEKRRLHAMSHFAPVRLSLKKICRPHPGNNRWWRRRGRTGMKAAPAMPATPAVCA